MLMPHRDLLNEVLARYGSYPEMSSNSPAPANAHLSPITSNGFLVDDILRSPAMAFPMPLPEMNLPADEMAAVASMSDDLSVFGNWPPELQALLGSLGGSVADLQPDVGDGMESGINWSSEMY